MDDGLSAWKAGVRRKGFETLLERARAGVTQGIAVWHVAIDGPTHALSSSEVARHWDQAETAQERRAMLVDAIGTDQVRVLPSIPGTRAHMFNPERIVLGPADAPLTPRAR